LQESAIISGQCGAGVWLRASIRITILIALLSVTAIAARAQTSAQPASGEIK
jgi:hypothetical protein